MAQVRRISMSPQPECLGPAETRSERRDEDLGIAHLQLPGDVEDAKPGGAISPASMRWKGHRVVMTYDHARRNEPCTRALTIDPVRCGLLRQLATPIGAIAPRSHIAQQVHDHVHPAILLRFLGIQLPPRTVLRCIGPKGESETVSFAKIRSKRFHLGRVEQLGRGGGAGGKRDEAPRTIVSPQKVAGSIRAICEGGPYEPMMGIQPDAALRRIDKRAECPSGRRPGQAEARQVEGHAAAKGYASMATGMTVTARKAKWRDARSVGRSRRCSMRAPSMPSSV